MEYIIPACDEVPAVFFYVVDITCDPSELMSLKSSITQSINLLPSESLVGLITFGRHSYLYNLSWPECSRCVAFKGDKILEGKSLKDYLSLGNDPKSIQSNIQKYILPISECEFTLNMIIEDLTRDPWTVSPGKRGLRCTGTALSLSLNLLEIAFARRPARVLLFTSGAATFGGGLIVSDDLNDSIRTLRDVKEDSTLYLKEAQSFYEALANKASLNSHTVDIFCCAIDQIGLFEMRSLCTKTGGAMILTDTYKSDVFSLSLQKLFARDETGALVMALDAQLKIWTSPGILVCGAVGPGVSLGQKVAYVSENEIGNGKTFAWRVGALREETSFGFYFESNTEEPRHNKGNAFVQFQVFYTHSSGRARLRVTTVRYPFIEASEPRKIVQGIDQEVSTVLLARLAAHRTENEATIEVVRWLDRLLIKFMKKFAEFRYDVPSSFRLLSSISLFPQFVFHLRRSQFLQHFNVSPDELAFYRIHLNRETTTNSLLMVQPALLKYSFETAQAEPTLLDVVSMKNDVILLLDSFFNVVVWKGDVIVKWVKLGYHELDEYEHLRVLLKMPVEDANLIVQQRFPCPKMTQTEAGKGTERLLKAKVNPSIVNSSSDVGNYFSEDVSLKVFMDSLIDFVVKS
jgi:protein transport protein SEC23